MDAACWICGAAAKPDPVYRSSDLFRCESCGFLFVPEQSSEDSKELYSDEYFDDFHGTGAYADEAAQHRHEAELRLSWVTQYVSAGRLLEIGAANGIFLSAARERGFEVLGVEPSPGYAERAKQDFDVDVRPGFIETVELPDQKFDVICGFHVLEHISDPRVAMRRLRELIADEGTLFLEFPNIESPKAQRYGEGWIHLDRPNHVAFYNRAQLAALLDQVGFELADFHTIAPTKYHRARQALRPGNLAMRAYDTFQTRGLQGSRHPTRHEFARAVIRCVRR